MPPNSPPDLAELDRLHAGATPGEWIDLINKSIPEPNSGCWLWLGQVAGKGYAQMWDKATKKNCYVSRWILEKVFGILAPGVKACHTCDTPLCINPQHLFRGTNRDNMLDAARKGRTKNGNSVKVMCKRGHPLSKSGLGTRISKRGRAERFCVECMLINRKACTFRRSVRAAAARLREEK